LLFYFPHLEGIEGADEKARMILYIFLASFIIIFIIIFLLYKLKMIAKITLDDQKDRYIPQLCLSIIYLLIALYLGQRYGLKNGLTLAMIASSLSAGLITIINRFWKISTHASGVSGVFAIASVLYWQYPTTNFLIPYILICCITFSVCISRLYLKVHTPMQIICGLLLGGLTGFSLFYFR
jgi:membrane-associated phospholipid phosphatase